MKARFMLVTVLLALSSGVSAEQSVKKDVFWDKLQNKLEKITPAKKSSTTTAVGGVRGAKNDAAGDIYWKGKEKAIEIQEEELQQFNLAVESKLKGNNEQALKNFEDFLAKYPQSQFRVEGLQAVEKLKMEIAAASDAANKPVGGSAAQSSSPVSDTQPAR